MSSKLADLLLAPCNLESAFTTAKQVEIDNYLVGWEESENTIIYIGSSSKAYMIERKYVSAELETTRDAQFIIFPTRCCQIKNKLEEVEKLLDYDVDAQTSSYVLHPTLAVGGGCGSC